MANPKLKRCTRCDDLVEWRGATGLCLSCLQQLLPGMTSLRLVPTPTQGRAAAVAGRDIAYDAAGDAWTAAAMAAVGKLARAGDRFTSNDVWLSGLAAPPSGNRRALGGVLVKAAADGVITKVGGGALSLHGHGSTGNAYWQGVTA